MESGVEAASTSCHVMRIGGVPGTGAGGVDLKNRPGSAPTEGFQACQIIVSQCTNANSNGVYFPAVPYAGKAVWQKPASDDALEVEVEVEGAEPKPKDRGERFIYYSEKAGRWYIGDALEEGGFTFRLSCGKSPMPPLQGWQQSAVLECQSATSEGGFNVPSAVVELPKLLDIQPWEDQEVCYVTMLKVLGNIVANPGEAKFCSLKLENAAIQKKILRFDGTRGFLEATGFRENAGALVLPTDRSAQAKMAHDLLEGFANEAQWDHIRKERHAKAAEEAKKEAANEGWKRPKADSSAGYGGGSESKGRGGGPMKG
mmetsp:Transcript_62873/g.138419  ORF Transcript_62873/g.138419 Transcript_62873/m.138419 type:complete len:315 (+) Transcript_62873:69-1013(+)